MATKDAQVAAPTASEILLKQFNQALAFYPQVVEAFYKAKVPDSRKRTDAIETDTWRYETLPKLVEKWESDQGFSKEELIKLVQWKVTHGTFRPFLLPQIRKNDPSIIKESSSQAHEMILEATANKKSSTDLDPKAVRAALDTACRVNGVGPATGTLLLSIFNPRDIPFFEDELYYWLHPDFQGKLKYSAKEYFELFDGVQKLRKRLGGGDEGHTMPDARNVEKVAFVMGHRGLLSKEEAGVINGATEHGERKTKDIGEDQKEVTKSDEEKSQTAKKRNAENDFSDSPVESKKGKQDDPKNTKDDGSDSKPTQQPKKKEKAEKNQSKEIEPGNHGTKPVSKELQDEKEPPNQATRSNPRRSQRNQ